MKFKKTAAALLAVMIAASVPLTGAENNGISITASAASTSSDGLWEYEANADNNNTLKLLKYLGNDTNIVIPETVPNSPKKITVISDDLFLNLPETVETISIPATVTGIANNKDLFRHISSLKEITVDEKNTAFCSKDGVLYGQTENSKYGTLIACPQAKTGTLELPKGVEIIGNGAFTHSQLSSVKLPDTVTAMYGYGYSGYGRYAAFYGSAIESMVIPASLTEISYDMFKNCTKLASITIPDSVTYIGESTFENCTALTSITIPDSVTEMGKYCFYNCSSLESIKLSANSDIPKQAFYGCTDIARVYVPEGVKELGEGSFQNCQNLEVVSLPSTLIDMWPMDTWDWYTPTFKESDHLQYVYYNGTETDLKEKLGDRRHFSDDTITIFRRDFKDAASGVIVSDGAGALPGIELEDCTVTASSKDIANGKRYTINATDLNKATFPFSMGSTVTIEIPIPEEYKYNILTVMQGNTKINAEKKNGYMVFQANKLNCDYDIVMSDVSVGVEVSVKAPNGTDTSGQKVTVTGNSVNKEIAITNGQLDISELADGTYTFTFSAKNCAPKACKVTVKSGAVTGLENGVKLHLFGDINGDGVVNTQDVARANAHVKGTSTLTGYDLACINVNNDANINVQDVALMNAHAKNTKLLW